VNLEPIGGGKKTPGTKFWWSAECIGLWFCGPNICIAAMTPSIRNLLMSHSLDWIGSFSLVVGALETGGPSAPPIKGLFSLSFFVFRSPRSGLDFALFFFLFFRGGLEGVIVGSSFPESDSVSSSLSCFAPRAAASAMCLSRCCS
jgi:hypothetical protein